MKSFKPLVFAEYNLLIIAFPLFQALVHINDMIAYFHHTVHIMGIDHCGDVVFFRDFFNQFVDEQGGLGVEAGVGFVAEKGIWDLAR